MDQKTNVNEEEVGTKRRNFYIYIGVSAAALIIVGAISFFILMKLKQSQSGEPTAGQEQFEGATQISSQLQTECQNSAAKILKSKDLDYIQAEYKQNAENCKDVYFALDEGKNEEKDGKAAEVGAKEESDSLAAVGYKNISFRKEGMFADLVVDIARLLAEKELPKAIELLQFSRKIKSWDFYLGPVSCDSQHVLDAYIESFQKTTENECVPPEELQNRFAKELINKNYHFLYKFINNKDVIWLGVPESDIGCPEKIASIIQTLEKLITGPVVVEQTSSRTDQEHPSENLVVKLSDKENIIFVFNHENKCAKLSSVLIPNVEIPE